MHFFIIYKIRKGPADECSMLLPIICFNLPNYTVSSLKATCTWKVTSNFIGKFVIVIIIIIYLAANGLSPGGSCYYACTYIKLKRLQILPCYQHQTLTLSSLF